MGLEFGREGLTGSRNRRIGLACKLMKLYVFLSSSPGAGYTQRRKTWCTPTVVEKRSNQQGCREARGVVPYNHTRKYVKEICASTGKDCSLGVMLWVLLYWHLLYV